MGKVRQTRFGDGVAQLADIAEPIAPRNRRRPITQASNGPDETVRQNRGDQHNGHGANHWH